MTQSDSSLDGRLSRILSSSCTGDPSLTMEPAISSVRNPVVRRARALLREPATREEQGCFIAEGPHIAIEALEAGADIEHALISAGAGDVPRLREVERLLLTRRVPCTRLRGPALAAVQDSDSPQGISLIVRMKLTTAGQTLGSRGARLVVVAWSVQDPGNLGAIIRSAEAAGARSVVTVRGGADPFHPRAVRASAGSVIRFPILRAAEPSSLPDLLRTHGLILAAGVPSGGVPPWRADLTGPLALLVGSEGAGLPAPVEQDIDRKITIPMEGGVRSLNVAVSAAVLLFEAARQRSAGAR